MMLHVVHYDYSNLRKLNGYKMLISLIYVITSLKLNFVDNCNLTNILIN